MNTNLDLLDPTADFDEWTYELADLWNTPSDGFSASVDWAALGIDPLGLDEQTREAIILLELPPPRPWRETAHDYQLRVADATQAYILMMAGRGSGKTFCAANTLVEWVLAEPGDYAIVAPTFGDAVKICADGPSGFIRAAGEEVERFNRNEYVIYMRNGSRVVLASADAPDRVRGWNLTGFWADEVGSWRDTTVWYEGLEFATRIGNVRRLITTTPRRGNKILKELLKQEADGDDDVLVVRASTMDNAANLSPTALRKLEQRYEGTTLGRQELYGEMLDEVEGALISGALIDSTRIRAELVPELHRIAVGVDPATTNKEGSDHTGIVVIGIGGAPKGWQPPAGKVVLAGAAHLYVLADYSRKLSAESWARLVLEVADEWDADVITAEVNNGGDLVETVVRQVAEAEGRPMPYFHAVTASKGKKARAEPVAGVIEQYRLHMLQEAPGGTGELEDEWTGWVPSESKESPDRLDASVWAAVELMPELSTKGGTRVQMLSAAG
jgi:phage terminase large subunit-like protein